MKVVFKGILEFTKSDCPTRLDFQNCAENLTDFNSVDEQSL